jgi:glycosyltransferase involved in cell wall biosynthesis
MKVLMVHKTSKGGVAVHVKEVARELRKMGIEVKEISRNEDLGITSFVKSYFKMRELFKKWSREYDIIHTHDWSIAYPAIKAKIKNLVATFHAFPTNFIANYFQTYVIRKLKSRAIVVSPRMKKYYVEATCIPNGVNLNFFRPLKVKREEIAGIAQEYNKKKIIKILEEMGIKWVSTEGALPFERLPEFFSKLKIFISIPYQQTGFNMVWLEAMACEVPYIIGTNAGIGEILPIYKVRTFYELKETLEKIKKGELQPLKNQREWIIKNKFTWKEHAKKLIKVYEEVLK